METTETHDAEPAWPSTPQFSTVRRAETFVRLARERLDHDPDEAASLALRAVDAARADGDQHGAAVGMLLLGQACHAAGNAPEEILRPLRFAIDNLKLHNDRRNLADARLLLATLYMEQCDYEEAASEARSAALLAKASGDPHLEALCELRLASIILEVNPSDSPEARRQLEDVARRFLDFGDRTNAARALYNLAVTSIDADAREAARLTARALEIGDDIAAPMVLAIRTLRTEAACRLGWVGVAETEFAEVERLALVHAQPATHQIALMSTRAAVHRVAGRLEEARDELHRALERAATIVDLFNQYHLNRELALVYELQGDFVGALGAVRDQHEAYVRMQRDEAARRVRVVQIAQGIEAERGDADAARIDQVELEQSVAAARAELAQAEQMLEWERSRRALVELRAARGPGVEPLTGLPNLSAIAGAVTKLLDELARIAVVVITVDEDRLVAAMPDARQRLLQEMSARTHALIRKIPGAMAGSLGSEDIAAVIPLPAEESEIHPILAELHAQLSRPVDLIDRMIGVTIQFGVALAPDHGVRANGLLSRARLAAQSARQQRPHGPSIAVFEVSVEQRQHLRTFVHAQLGAALANEHLVVHYQPIVSAQTGAAVGAEALVRWVDPERGLISPADFISLAEETGQIVELGGYVLQRACCDAAAWPLNREGVEPTVSVNVSAAQVVGGTILSQVEAALLVSGLRPDRLALELTESTLASHADVVAVLQALRSKGIRVEIDDFGTGYSSFSYLTRFPVDCVKIDKSFVDRVASQGDDAAITQAIITMAHSLRLSVIAEGVEDDDQASVLTAQGCDQFQGWLYARAMPAAEFGEWMTAFEPPSALGDGSGTTAAWFELDFQE